MTENEPSIHQLMNQLREAMAQVQAGEKKENLAAVLDRIESRLQAHLDEDHQRDLVAELNEQLVEFEVEHPSLAGTMRNLMHLLGSLGV